MISCDKATILCNKTQYGEATFIEKLKLRYHLFICKTCAMFTIKNTRLTSLCEKAVLHSLSEKEKMDLKENIQRKI